jgi:hypothetical protein
MSADDPFLHAYREGDWMLLRLGEILVRIPQVRNILRRIERESRDEESREQARGALELLEVSDVRR